MQPGGLPQRMAQELGRLLGPDFPKHLGLAVSGGGDSMALLYLAAPWARVMGITLWPVTVDHGLRAESAGEAAMVARACAELGLTHTTLRWHWDGHGNVQAAGRAARLALMDRWRAGVEHILFAHTQDDVAETFLMRLARGSGVDGLAVMEARHPVHPHPAGYPALDPADITGPHPPIPERRVAGVPAYTNGFDVIRPLLTTTRAELRHYLKVLQIDYVDDPSNDDPRYDRVKMRQAQPALDALGLTAPRLAETARHMARAQEVLTDQAWAAHQRLAATGPGEQLFDIAYDRDGFAALPGELQLRLLAAALQFVSLNPYRPRLTALEDARDRALGGGATTLHGGYVLPHRAQLYICAEHAQIRDTRPENGRWRGVYPTPAADIRALGEQGAAQIRHLSDLPARVLWPCPAVWDVDTVVSCPRIGQLDRWKPAAGHARLQRIFRMR
ncbi:MAG: tRNA lysidine(34) synthetase TilS [Pseudomonadota bacterium]